MAKDGSGMTTNGMADSGTGPNQDGFNHDSHVTKFADPMGSKPQVGRDQAGAVDPRGKGGTMGDGAK